MSSDPVISLLRDLVAINSVNPSLVPGAPGEEEIAGAIAARMRQIGMDVAVEEVSPGRPNVVGVLEGRAPGRSLMLCGHLDTVGVDGMAAPFDPLQKDGRLYGRGAQDLKGGVAAMIDAARLVTRRGLPAGRLLIAAVVDEEYASIGADALVARWRADGAVVTEPTDLEVAVAHKGFAWCEVETRGRAAHGSRPHEGRDAIVRMGRVLHALEALDRDLQSRAPHVLMGTASVHASIITGGRELSSYPDRCVLQYERRTIAGETPAMVEQEMADLIGTLHARDADFEATARMTVSRPAYEIARDHALPQALARAATRACGAAVAFSAMTFWTDAAALGDAGIPSVLFGPGGAGLHGLEEYVIVEDVLRCRDALALLAEEWCGSK